MLCDHLEGWDREGAREVQEGGDICMHMADSLWCTTGTNSIVKQLYSNKDLLKKRRRKQATEA